MRSRPQGRVDRGMRLLLINFEMDADSPVLAWQESLATRLCRETDFTLVLTEKIGRCQPPENMHLHVLRRRPFQIPWRFGGGYLLNPQVHALCRQHEVNACFVHMNHRWLVWLRPTLERLQLPILLWYAHGTVTPSLRTALEVASRVVTSSPEGFRIPSSKVRIIGQGIDSDLFDIPASVSERNDILYVGRMSRRKRIDLLLETFHHMRKSPAASQIRLRLIGPELTRDDVVYGDEMRRLSAALGLQEVVDFVGPVRPQELPSYHASAFLHLNVSRTGSMDKTVLEALSCGCPALTSNEAFFAMLEDRPEFIVRDERPEAIAAQALQLYAQRNAVDRQTLRKLVVGRHDLNHYAEQILENLRDLRADMVSSLKG